MLKRVECHRFLSRDEKGRLFSRLAGCARGLEEFDVKNYLPPEPLAAWIENLMMKGRRKMICNS